MFSFMAALRTLVLPFGTITGRRIVLDGTNGRIDLYDADDVLVISQDAATASTRYGELQSLQLDGRLGALLLYAGEPGPANLIGSLAGTGGEDEHGNTFDGGLTIEGGTLSVVSLVNSAFSGGSIIDAGASSFAGSVVLETGNRAFSGTLNSESQQITFGSSVVTTNGSGQWSITTGRNPLRGFVAWNGDVGARPNMVIGNNRGNFPVNTTGQASGTCYTGNTGATINSANVRIDWIAFGV